MARIGLQQMLGAQAFHAFLDAHWPHQLFVSHGDAERIAELQHIAAFRSPEALFAHWPEAARAWSPRELQQPSPKLPADQLAAAYSTGHTIYLTRVERHVRDLIPWIRGVERDLRLRRGDVTCEVICSHTGQGAKPHFDPSMTVNVQLYGRKAWRVATNDSVVNPDVAGTLGEAIPAELQRMMKQGYPDAMPADAAAFETTAGSVVFLPHGCWHATTCAEPSMALLFTVVSQGWHTLLGAEVEQVLRGHEECRTTALIAAPGVAQREQSRQQLRTSLERLKVWIAEVEGDGLLRKWAGPPMTTFSRTALAADPSMDTDLLAWVETQGGVFHSADAIDAFPTTPPQEVLRRIWALESMGILQAE